MQPLRPKLNSSPGLGKPRGNASAPHTCAAIAASSGPPGLSTSAAAADLEKTTNFASDDADEDCCSPVP
jgi:hypothetical protein